MVAGEREESPETESVIPPDAKKILYDLASSWSHVDDIKAMEVVPITGAMTNLVYQVNWLSKDHDNAVQKVLLRIYGDGVDIFFDRNDEIQTFKFMSEQGQGPRLLGCFQGGRLEEFLPRRVRLSILFYFWTNS